MGFQSSLLAWVLVELSFRFSHREIIVGVTLLFTLTVMQIIVLKECLRIKRHKRQNKNRYVLPARRPQRPAQEADPAGGGPGGGACQDAGEAGADLGYQHPAITVSDGLQRVPGAAVPAEQVRPARRLAHAVLGGVPSHLQALRGEGHHGRVRGRDRGLECGEDQAALQRCCAQLHKRDKSAMHKHLAIHHGDQVGYPEASTFRSVRASASTGRYIIDIILNNSNEVKQLAVQRKFIV